MSRLVYGHRIGKQGKLTTSCCAAIFDCSKDGILLTKRSDNHRWCIPGGAMEAGESAEEACVREVLEETGLHIIVTKLIGVYSNPHFVVEYDDGNCIQPVGLCFEGNPIGGELVTTKETISFGYYTQVQIESIDVVEDDLVVINDAFTKSEAAFIR